MFESNGVLRTWALASLPAEDSAEIHGEQLADHRLDFLTLEGPLTGDRGNVRRVEEGTYAVLAESPDAWDVRLNGLQFAGRLSMSRENESRWHIHWSSDAR
jgi:hypothetical protein